MALSDVQWGRLLALAWIDPAFKGALEMDPALAIKNLKTSGKLTAVELQAIGLDPSPTVQDHLLNLGTISYYTDYTNAKYSELDAIVSRGGKHDEDGWFWDGILGATATSAPSASSQQGGISMPDWSRIYARIWIDHRLNEPGFGADPIKYPLKNHRGAFEKDPATTVENITKSPLLNNIPYAKGITPLFSLLEKPDTWTGKQLERCVKTGDLNGYPLGWICKKCC